MFSACSLILDSGVRKIWNAFLSALNSSVSSYIMFRNILTSSQEFKSFGTDVRSVYVRKLANTFKDSVIGNAV